jgi:hypothetical protein
VCVSTSVALLHVSVTYSCAIVAMMLQATHKETKERKEMEFPPATPRQNAHRHTFPSRDSDMCIRLIIFVNMGNISSRIACWRLEGAVQGGGQPVELPVVQQGCTLCD